MNDEFVNKKNLYKKLHNAGGCDAPKNSWADGWDKGIDEAIGILNDEPTISLIRCKDCEKWEKYENTAGSGYCHCEKFKFHYGGNLEMTFTPITGPEDYCSFGSRRIYGKADR